MTEDSQGSEKRAESARAKRWVVRYAALTLALFVPLLWAFISIRNLYPISASTMMMSAGSDLQKGGIYYILRGESVDGQAIDIPAIELTDALTGRNFGMVSSAVENSSFKLRSPHPSNAALIAEVGGVNDLPRAARVNDLLKAWGIIYNSRLPQSSSRRLKAMRLDAFYREEKRYAENGRHIETWKAEL